MKALLHKRFQGKKFYPFFIFLLLMLAGISVFGQEGNQERYEVMMLEGVKRTLENKQIAKIEGFVTEPLKEALLNYGTGDSVTIRFQKPVVQLNRVKGGKIARNLQGGYSIVGDSTGLLLEFEASDTLEKKALKMAQQTEYPELQGKYTGPGKKWVFPAVVVVTGVGVVLSLFYVRSQ